MILTTLLKKLLMLKPMEKPKKIHNLSWKNFHLSFEWDFRFYKENRYW